MEQFFNDLDAIYPELKGMRFNFRESILYGDPTTAISNDLLTEHPLRRYITINVSKIGKRRWIVWSQWQDEYFSTLTVDHTHA